jgi:hypothetical protein
VVGRVGLPSPAQDVRRLPVPNRNQRGQLAPSLWRWNGACAKRGIDNLKIQYGQGLSFDRLDSHGYGLRWAWNAHLRVGSSLRGPSQVVALVGGASFSPDLTLFAYTDVAKSGRPRSVVARPSHHVDGTDPGSAQQ